MRLVTIVLVALGAGGCQASVEGGGSPDAMTAPDAAPSGPSGPSADAAVQAPACSVAMPEDFGQLGAVTPASNGIYWGIYSAFIKLEEDPYRNLFVMAIPGKGVFTDGVVPGEFDLTGKDTDFEHCSACVNMYAQIGDTDEETLVMATGGKLTITSLEGDKLSGSIEGVTLQAIEIVRDGNSTACETGDQCENTSCKNNLCGRQVAIDNCTMSIGSLSF